MNVAAGVVTTNQRACIGGQMQAGYRGTEGKTRKKAWGRPEFGQKLGIIGLSLSLSLCFSPMSWPKIMMISTTSASFSKISGGVREY